MRRVWTVGDPSGGARRGPGLPATLVAALEDDIAPLTSDPEGPVRVPVGPFAVVSVRLGLEPR